MPMSHAASEALPAPPLAAEQRTIPAAHTVSVSKTTPPEHELTSEQEIALNELVAETRSSTPLDPAAEYQLRSELRQARQDEWPLVVKQFRSALAYSQQLAAREGRPTNAQLPASHAAKPTVSTHGFDVPEERTVESHHQQASLPNPPIHLASHTEPLPTRGTTVANRSAEAITTSMPHPSESALAVGEVTQASYVDSQAQLMAAIEIMQQEVKSHPGSTDELQEHMKLRMLQLMAGRENDSLAPMPGASPTEQDYWSKQLFALSTYFDTARQPDTKQRAAGALVHLDAARAKLAEIASLQVRNLTFVDRIDGFGLYEPHAVTKFKPGDQVTLYAEVDNFRSESTKEGYRTTLATSYEVVDPQGRRVDGAQFPEVEDICRNQRHDFHMQYGVALPTRIYPGTYEMRLIITDQLSNKIGQASVSFEIID